MPRKRRKIPRHPDLEALMPALGPCKKPESLQEELVEAIDSRFMFEGFPGFEEGVLDLRNFLTDYDVDPNSKTGQAVLQEYAKHAVEEYYGDFDRWVCCDACGKEFQPDYSLDYINRILARGIICSSCAEQKL